MDYSLKGKTLAIVDADSVAYAGAYAVTKRNMRVKIDTLLNGIRGATGCELEIWLEHPDNKNIFRNHVAVTKPYKGNRKDGDRPPLLVEAKEYLVEEWGANMTRHLEAEDVVLTRGNEVGVDKAIIAAIDKDLYQANFLFYNYNTEKFRWVSEQEAEINFWKQVLTGDPSDNIVGLPKVGKVTAGKILAASDVIPYPLLVAEAYNSKGYSYAYMVEQCRLIYILRHWKDVFVFPLTQEEYNKLGETDV